MNAFPEQSRADMIGQESRLIPENPGDIAVTTTIPGTLTGVQQDRQACKSLA